MWKTIILESAKQTKNTTIFCKNKWEMIKYVLWEWKQVDSIYELHILLQFVLIQHL